MVYTRGSITKWSRLGGAIGVISMFLPEGPFKWAALSLALVAFFIAATRVPRQAWREHKLLLGSLGCVVGAMFAVELLDLNANLTAWIVGVTGPPRLKPGVRPTGAILR
jgi:hypothetical protein